MLEKKRLLRNIEFTLTNDEINPDCHKVYHDVILENGQELMKSIHREVGNSVKVLQELNEKKLHTHVHHVF